MRYNSVHSVSGNLVEKKALINFANWGRGGENERKREFHLRRVRAGKGVRDKQKNMVTHWDIWSKSLNLQTEKPQHEVVKAWTRLYSY